MSARRITPAFLAGVLIAFSGGLALTTVPLSASAQTAAAATVSFDIPAQDLGTALTEFARQSGQEMLFAPDIVAGKTSAPLSGELSREAAMAELLKGTGLRYEIHSTGSMIIGDDASIEAYRARLQSSAVPAEPNGVAQVDPALTDPGVAAPGEQTTASVEVSRTGGLEEIIVTGQKRAERIQDVPIAISAFTMDDLDNQKIEGGFDLLKGVPNVTFSKTNFSGYNFQIRGIGTQAVSATTDPGVAVSFNNTTLIVNRLFEQEYLDIERVEVLRGPQGTLYGRNATAGVINVISAKPELGVYEGEIKIETGNYGAQRLRGYYNFPVGEDVALRAAYGSTVRDGYGINQAASDLSVAPEERPSSDIDDRNLWTGRLTLGWEPTDRVRVNLLYERFEEDDQRVRSVKQLCHRDEGRTQLRGLDLSTLTSTATGGAGIEAGVILQDTLSQGCLPGSLYDDAAFGAPNGFAIPFLAAPREPNTAGMLGDNPYTGNIQIAAPCEGLTAPGYLPIYSPCVGDPFANSVQSRDMRTIYSLIEPRYEAESDVFELSVDVDITDGLVLSSQTVYVKDAVLSTQDFNRFETAENFFSDSQFACPGTLSGSQITPFGVNCTTTPSLLGTSPFADVSPGGIFCDPQLGCSDRFLFMDLSRASGSQFNQEVRLVSSLSSDLNFSIGANYTRFETTNDYFVMSNGLSVLANLPPFAGPAGLGTGRNCNPGLAADAFYNCVYVDPQSLDELIADDSPEGHNYFLSRNPYSLDSAAIFGEVYWQATDMLKFTAGLRVTWDRKSFTPVPSQTLLAGYKQTFGQFPYEDPSQCTGSVILSLCQIYGSTEDGRGFVADPDIVQSWLEPTGRIGFDWKLDTGFTDETMVYGFLTRGYKAGGANPPGIAPPQGAFIAAAQGAVAPKVFKAEYVNALELGAKNMLLDGALTLNVSGFYYDYQDYQVSKIVDRSAANENFDATVWGLELEAMFAPTSDTLVNAAIGYLRTRIEDGEQSLDLMDRTQGGNQFYITTIENPNFDPNSTPLDRADYVAGLDAPDNQQFFAFDEWLVVKPSVTQASNCIAPAELAEIAIENKFGGFGASETVAAFCPGGPLLSSNYSSQIVWGTDDLFPDIGGIFYNPSLDAPNGSAGFLADVGGNELPNAPRFTVSLGAQHTLYLPGSWDLTGRVDWYWQDESFHRVYNTEYDRLQDWTNTNLSIWINKTDWGLKIEAYVKNVFDETPITGAFLNSDDTALTTNVFTLDPRLFGVSITKRF